MEKCTRTNATRTPSLLKLLPITGNAEIVLTISFTDFNSRFEYVLLWLWRFQKVTVSFNSRLAVGVQIISLLAIQVVEPPLHPEK